MPTSFFDSDCQLDTKSPFLDLDLFITNGIVSTKMYNKRDDFNFEVVHFLLILLMEMFVALLMVYTFRNFSVLQEYVPMLITSTIETHFDF